MIFSFHREFGTPLAMKLEERVTRDVEIEHAEFLSALSIE